MKKIILLGASGSIGQQTIDVLRHYPDLFELVGFSVGENISFLEEILKEFSCSFVCVKNAKDLPSLQEKFPKTTFFSGDQGLIELVSSANVDLLINALVGFTGLIPTIKAIELKIDIALANKETLVVAGEIVLAKIKEYGVKLFPIDSEHSAILQCLQGNEQNKINKILITASGGSFRKLTREQLKDVTVADALNHPNWKMGAKITIDSATMMNKGFEVIEAHYLFDLDYDDIDVVMHDESIIHSMVMYQDYSIMAQCATSDMRLPIQYALTFPQRLPVHNTKPLDFAKLHTLHFNEPNYQRFPLLKLAYECGRKKGNLPAVLNAANEVCNLAFRNGKISFLAIDQLVQEACNNVEFKEKCTIEDILYYDQWARDFVTNKITGE